MSGPGEFLAINGSPSARSKTHSVASLGVELMDVGEVIDLCSFDAEALLGRRSDPELSRILDAMATTKFILLVTPVYRATYSGLLKVLLDQLQQGALKNVVGCWPRLVAQVITTSRSTRACDQSSRACSGPASQPASI